MINYKYFVHLYKSNTKKAGVAPALKQKIRIMRYKNMQSEVEKQLSQVRKQLATLRAKQTELEQELIDNPHLQYQFDKVMHYDKSKNLVEWYIHSFYFDKEEGVTRVLLISTGSNEKALFVSFDTVDSQDLCDKMVNTLDFL